MKAQIYNYQIWINETNPEILKHKLEEYLHESGFGVLNCVEHYFEPFGYTALWLLSESHLAVHTFPEEGQSYLELSSCVEKPFKNFLKLI